MLCKVSTRLDENLFRRARLEAVRQGRRINVVIAEALERYLDECGTPGGATEIVRDSWGALKAQSPDVASIMAQDDFLGS
jgi:hypothetical protein